MTLTAAIAVLLGAVASLLTAILTRPTWTPERKRVTALIVAAVLGLVTAVATGQVEGIPPSLVGWLGRILITIAIVVVASQGIYAQLKDALELVERASTPRRALEEEAQHPPNPDASDAELGDPDTDL